ncbi:glycoside hydrolase family 78 protein [Paenibacillus sp. BAC0078]
MVRLKRILFTMMPLIMLFSLLSELNDFTETAYATSDNPNVINYKNITIPATTSQRVSPYGDGSTTGSINTITFSNIQYDKTTRKISYDFNQDAKLITNTTLDAPIDSDDVRVEESTLCTGILGDDEYPLKYPDNLDFYGCGQYQMSHPGLVATIMDNHWFQGPLSVSGGSFGASFNLATDIPYATGQSLGTVWNNVTPGRIPMALFVRIAWTAGKQASWRLGPQYGFNYPMIGHTMNFVIPLEENGPPTISLNSPNDQVLQNEPGRNTMNIEGYVHDPDNDDLIVSAEIPNVFYKKTVVKQTKSYQPFSIPIDVIADSIPPGDYTINVKVADPSDMSASTSMTVKVRIRLKRNAFVLVNTPVENSGTTYKDYESDPKYAERVRYDHDPNYFENPMGMINDSGLWRTQLYSSFPYTGEYVVTYQAKDNPKADAAFSEYQMWSRDAASTMSFQVHRKPIALFAAKLAGSTVQLIDSSYDLDHVSSDDKGLSQWQWQYKKSAETMWVDGKPGVVSATDNYDIRLRVRDIDGNDGLGAWSDWCQRTVGTAAGNLPPVAMFTVNPSIVSYRKATTIIDKSFDPDNDPLDTYKWSVVKDGWNTVWSHYGAANTPPNIAGYGIGDYQISLQVRDNRGSWSENYSQNVKVVNHPPVAAFNMPNEVYRDTVIALDNQTPDPDADGDALTYIWNARINNSPYYWSGNNRYQSMTIRDLINRNGISPKQAISEGWEMRLTASDGSLSSNATRTFVVKNHAPVAAINGGSNVHQFDTQMYSSNDMDEDTSDQSSLSYYWKVTNADGDIRSYRTPNVALTFLEPGVYTLEHWAIDQIGDKSNIAVLQVKVDKNLAPSMTITSPAGTLTAPTVLDAELQGDPLVKWAYSDPENDQQEQYHLDFCSKEDDLLVYSVENADPTGLLRQYQIPNKTFERFKYFYLNGRVFSKNSWSDISNEKAFIIDNPPKPGFTLITDTGRNAAMVPIYRTDVLQIQSTASDADVPKGDSITHQYFLKPSNGMEGLISTQSAFTKQFTTNGTFTLRQVVTDSLGLYRELTQTITVVNRTPTLNITYPTSTSQASPTIASTLTPVIKWDYQDEDGDQQQRYKVRIINLTTGAVTVQSGEQTSSAKQWQIPANALVENQKYAVEVEVYDGFNWSSVSPRKYFMVNLLSVKGGVQHTAEWNGNRQAYNLNKSGNAESPRGYNVYWAGERFVLQANATGLPDTIEVAMSGGYTTNLSPTDSKKTIWTGELYDPAFEKLPDGPVTFTFTARNEYNVKTDAVTVTILGDWTEYFQSHRVK